MVKVYNGVQMRRVKGYGMVPYHMQGDGYGQVLFQSGKQMARYAAPLLKKVWADIPPATKQAMFDATINLGIRGAKKVGTTVRSAFGRGLGEDAHEKLSALVEDVPDRISAKAEQMLRKMASQTKKRVRKELKHKTLPKSVASLLTPAQRKKLSQSSEVMLSNLLAGKGLRLI